MIFLNLRKLLLIIGILLIVGGIGVIVWFFAQNKVSEDKMKVYTEEFMESLEKIPTVEEKPQAKVLVGNTTGVLEFPAFKNERIAIKEGTTNYILSIASGHMTATEQVWEEAGNSAIAAHNNTFFKNVDKFKIGDKVLVYTRAGIFEYEVFLKKAIAPTDLSVLDDIAGQKTLTLITCNFSGSKRVVVQAKGGIKIAAAKDI